MYKSQINKNSYNLVAKNYAEEHGKELVWQQELDKFINHLVNPLVVLDLGCGNGNETFYLASQLQQTKLTGVDFAEEMLKIASLYTNINNIEFIEGDIENYIPSTKVDAIWARAAFHHLNNTQIENLFNNIVRYATDNLVIGMINKYGDTEEIEKKEKYGTMLQRYFNYFNEAKVQELAEKYNFEILESYVKEEGGHEFLVSFLKRKGLENGNS